MTEEKHPRSEGAVAGESPSVDARSSTKGESGTKPGYEGPTVQAEGVVSLESLSETEIGDRQTELPEDSQEQSQGVNASLLGQVLDRKYELISLLGKGGMGAVYEARHLQLGSKVAVKVLHSEAAEQTDVQERFRREARAAGTIGHPNIVHVHDIGDLPDGLPYMVMELIDGESLADIVYRETPLKPERAIRLACQILSALEAAHDEGVVHRDIKPENIIVGRDGDGEELAKILDFGISKFRELDPEQHGLTRTGTILGTPLYMAPEQAAGEVDIDHRIDIYAVGAVLYVLLSGHQPFHAPNYNALMVKIITSAPTPLSEHNPDLDGGLVNTVERAMARDRDERFKTAAAFREALLGERDVEPLPAPTVESTSKGSSKRGRFFAVGLLALVAVAGLGWFLFGKGGDVGRSGGGESGDEQPALVATADASTEGSTGRSASDEGLDGDLASLSDGDRVASQPRDDVFVKIRTRPDDATLTINGAEVDNPYERSITRAQDLRLFVQVEARGYRAYSKVYSLGEDIDTLIELERLSARPSVSKRPRERSLHIKGFDD